MSSPSFVFMMSTLEGKVVSMTTLDVETYLQRRQWLTGVVEDMFQRP